MKKNYIKLKFKNKEDWLKAKEQTISGSEAAAILNKSPWLTPNDVYNKFVYGKAKVVKENEYMRDGTNAEPHIRALFALDDKRYKVKNPPKRGYWMFVRKDYPFISVTPDGLMVETINKRKWGLEIKDVRLYKKEEKNLWEGNVLPSQYYCQDLQYMLVLNDLYGVVLVAHLQYFKFNPETKKWDFDYAVDRPYYIVRNNKDVKSHIAFLEKKEVNFYEINIKGRKRPKLVVKLNKSI